ncbi:hypothetical protein J5N97_028540 [Dioscorea zingiberensis]|uniref:Uncharacterized protein n=1 Tax=Dioscorea zingiberensis TaxID=325984 RepID=A0A9D5BZ40_9LILI|nr:hypothetical protein J5N97_028540 [Dioscorea zingiberensis]
MADHRSLEKKKEKDTKRSFIFILSPASIPDIEIRFIPYEQEHTITVSHFSSPPGRGRSEDVIIEFTMRGMQISTAEMHARMRVRAVLPARPAAQVRARSPCLRREQRRQAAQ